MNCFSHAIPFLHDPYMAVGACLPDWLGAADRRVRVREQVASAFVDDTDPDVASLAKGIVQHHQDDRWFHQSEPFVQLSMLLSLEARDLLNDERGFRPGLIGHIVIELMLDAYLHEVQPGKLAEYYELVAATNSQFVQNTVNRMAPRSTEKLVNYFAIFLRERYIFDYSNDARLMYRLNRVFQRVKLAPVGDELDVWLPTVRSRVYEQSLDLLPHHVVERL